MTPPSEWERVPGLDDHSGRAYQRVTPPSDSIEAQEATLRDLFGLDYGLIADEPARQALLVLADRAREAERERDENVDLAVRLEMRAERAEAEAKALREALENARRELGKPFGDYPAPVANAYDIISAALAAAESTDG